MKTILKQAMGLAEQLTDIRRDLHRQPELSFKEYRTTEYITRILLQAGIEIVPWGGETGVVGLLKGGQPGPVVALRADIDGLPVTEENQCPHQSQQPGVMHACGHDAHTACLLGAALILAGRRASLTGTVKFIFQPAEEINAGAQQMLDRGVLAQPAVDVIFGLHNTPTLAAGQIGCKDGPLMAAVDTTFLTIRGTGGHGAIPHSTRDPITAAAAVIQGLQTIVSRQVDPQAAAVISFGTIHGGQAHNVIPDKVELTGTVRTFDAALRRQLPDKMQGLISGIAQALGTQAEFVYRQDLPAVFNPPGLAAWCRSRLEQVVGAAGLVVPVPSMGGEDFALFQEQVPGVFLWLGVGNPAQGIVHQWHHPCFDIDEAALPYGAAALAQLAWDYLTGNGPAAVAGDKP